MPERLFTAARLTNAGAVAGLVRVLFPDAETALDATWGRGMFWRHHASSLRVTGLDRNPAGRPSVVGDFTALPFADDSFDLCVFDPPYQWDMGRGKGSIIGLQFGTYDSEAEARRTVQLGAAEAWRVARLGILVKVQNYIHGSKLVHMTRWVEDAIPMPLYDELHLVTPRKLMVPRWGDQLSVYRNHATFLAFRKGNQRHVRRRPPISMPVLAEAAG